MDKIKAISNEIQDLEDQVRVLDKRESELMDADYLNRQVSHKCSDFFDELAYYWHGDSATRFISYTKEEASDKVQKLQIENDDQMDNLSKERKVTWENIQLSEEKYQDEKRHINEERNASWD